MGFTGRAFLIIHRAAKSLLELYMSPAVSNYPGGTPINRAMAQAVKKSSSLLPLGTRPRGRVCADEPRRNNLAGSVYDLRHSSVTVPIFSIFPS